MCSFGDNRLGSPGLPLTLALKALVSLTLSGMATGFLGLCCFRTLKAGEASKVAPADKLSVAHFAVLLERPTVREWAGIPLVGVGVLVLTPKR